MNHQIVNCLLALEHWSRVKPGTVNLNHWRCGTHACFGGHLATWPEFQAKGIVPCYDFAPVMLHDRDSDPTDVSAYLFGDATMFNSRANSDLDAEDLSELSDYEIVVHRLEKQIERLSCKL